MQLDKIKCFYCKSQLLTLSNNIESYMFFSNTNCDDDVRTLNNTTSMSKVTSPLCFIYMYMLKFIHAPLKFICICHVKWKCKIL